MDQDEKIKMKEEERKASCFPLKSPQNTAVCASNVCMRVCACARVWSWLADEEQTLKSEHALILSLTRLALSTAE